MCYSCVYPPSLPHTRRFVRSCSRACHTTVLSSWRSLSCVYVVVRHAFHTHAHACSEVQRRACLTVLSWSAFAFVCVVCPIRPAANRGRLVLVQGAREAVCRRGGGVAERGREATATGVGALARGGGAPCGDDGREIGGAGVLRPFGGETDVLRVFKLNLVIWGVEFDVFCYIRAEWDILM